VGTCNLSIIGLVDLSLGDLTRLHAARGTHNKDICLFQNFWPIPQIKGDKAYPLRVIKDTVSVKFQSLFPDFGRRVFCVVVFAHPLDKVVQKLLLTFILNDGFYKPTPNLDLKLPDIGLHGIPWNVLLVPPGSCAVAPKNSMPTANVLESKSSDINPIKGRDAVSIHQSSSL